MITCNVFTKIADDRRPHPLFLLIIEASVRRARAFFVGPAVCAWHPVGEDRRTKYFGVVYNMLLVIFEINKEQLNL